MTSFTIGVLYATIAFTTFGLYPLYFKQLDGTPYLQVTTWRVVWSFPIAVALFVWKSDWKAFVQTALTRASLQHHTISAVLLGGLWLLYLYGVEANYIVEISLGFFINPVLSVILAVVVLKEPLRRVQQLAVAIAIGGVIVVAIGYGKFPWLGLSIGACLALYGLMKKTSPLGPIDSIFLEVTILLLPSAAALVAMKANGTMVFMHSSAMVDWFLVGSGVVTVLPLLLYASAAQKISFTLIGLLQYIGPMLTFLFGVFIFHEEFSTARLIGFIFVWVALAMFAVEGIVNSRIKARKTSIVTLASTDTGVDMDVTITVGAAGSEGDSTAPVHDGFNEIIDSDHHIVCNIADKPHPNS
ncbi:protein RarD [Aphanomyces invadans]|uniref:Protein RarD n=1 Tax=Aphanomyces invadans TaxID=157072 RepID=A0A024TQH6_9STRA|nr:protein RarD [Aphanomyces invadans]ETV95866.1 protein RarD [Aphanomyces invadans]RHY29124.1 hypothetical protein DYB32_005404 [Aphanomyces invadans]|eukprot:XP_008875617.1 protein RarD [Aphanomyces invadans]